MRKFLNYKSGQSLIEVLIAFAVTVIIGVGLISASLVTQRASTSARNNAQATKLAQQYIEQVRVIRDLKGYVSLPSAAGCYKISAPSTDPNSWTLLGTGVGAPCSTISGDVVNIPEFKAVFTRDLELAAPVNNTRKVTVRVSWAEGTNTRSVQLESTLSQW